MAFGSLNQKLPTVEIIGSVSGDFTVDPYVSGSTLRTTSGNSGTVGVAEIYKGIFHHCHDLLPSGLPDYPSIVGDATISITPPSDNLDGDAVTTRIHLTFNNRSPGPIASSPLAMASPAPVGTQESFDNINHYNKGMAIVGTSAVVVNSRPGSNLCTVKLRTYRVATITRGGDDFTGISPYDRSGVLIIKFALKNHSW